MGPTRGGHVAVLLLVQKAIYFFPVIPVVVYLIVSRAFCDQALRQSEGLLSLFRGLILFLGEFDELS
jgi:hypothetical protein